MIRDVERPVVVVTGCSSGIGRSTAIELARAGIEVVAGFRRLDDGSEQLIGESELITPMALDVTDQDSIERAAASVRDRYGDGIDGLVNNAGIAVAGPLEWVPAAQWQRQFDVNVLGIVRVTQQFLPQLRSGLLRPVSPRRRWSGRIINISSAASRLALPMLGPYASSKSAVEGLSDSLRRELSDCGIKVIVICPGQTATPIFSKAETEARSRIESLIESSEPPYRKTMTRMVELMHQSELSRRCPGRVASVIVKALTARHPRRRYHVGWDAKGALLVQRVVPQAVVDWVIARQLRPNQQSDTESG